VRITEQRWGLRVLKFLRLLAPPRLCAFALNLDCIVTARCIVPVRYSWEKSVSFKTFHFP
jgi:hypothetical protein